MLENIDQKRQEIIPKLGKITKTEANYKFAQPIPPNPQNTTMFYYYYYHYYYYYYYYYNFF